MLFVWVFLYSLVLSAANAVADPRVRSFFLVGYAVALLLWLYKTGRQKRAGLDTTICPERKAVIYLLPLLVFPAHNLLFCSGAVLTGSVWLEILSVCLVEEVFFRGLLLSWLRKQGVFRGILLTSLAFSLIHLTNVFSVPDGQVVLLQVASSFCVSLCYCVVTLRWGNVFPCVAAHFLTNVFGTNEIVNIPALLWCSVLHALWGSAICLKIQKEEEKQNEILH